MYGIVVIDKCFGENHVAKVKRNTNVAFPTSPAEGDGATAVVGTELADNVGASVDGHIS